MFHVCVKVAQSFWVGVVVVEVEADLPRVLEVLLQAGEHRVGQELACQLLGPARRVPTQYRMGERES